MIIAAFTPLLVFWFFNVKASLAGWWGFGRSGEKIVRGSDLLQGVLSQGFSWGHQNTAIPDLPLPLWWVTMGPRSACWCWGRERANWGGMRIAAEREVAV